MKTYKICNNDNNGAAIGWDIVAWVKEDSPLNALKRWYAIINSMAGQFKNFTYTAIPY